MIGLLLESSPTGPHLPRRAERVGVGDGGSPVVALLESLADGGQIAFKRPVVEALPGVATE